MRLLDFSQYLIYIYFFFERLRDVSQKKIKKNKMLRDWDWDWEGDRQIHGHRDYYTEAAKRPIW